MTIQRDALDAASASQPPLRGVCRATGTVPKRPPVPPDAIT